DSATRWLTGKCGAVGDATDRADRSGPRRRVAELRARTTGTSCAASGAPADDATGFRSISGHPSRAASLNASHGAHASPTPHSSLPRHCDAEPLLGADQVIEILSRLRDVQLHPVDPAGEDALVARIVVADR